MTWFGRVSPGARFRLDAVGRGAPAGNTVTKVFAVAPTPVTFRTTAVASAGTADSFSRVVPPAATAPSLPPVPTRVSSTRVGATGVKAAPFDGGDGTSCGAAAAVVGTMREPHTTATAAASAAVLADGIGQISFWGVGRSK